MKIEYLDKDFWKNYMINWFGAELIDKWEKHVEIEQIDSVKGKINIEIYRNVYKMGARSTFVFTRELNKEMGAIEIIIIGLGLSFDTFAVSVSTGLLKSSIRFWQGVKIAFILALYAKSNVDSPVEICLSLIPVLV